MKLCTVCGVVTSRAGRRCTEHARESNRSPHNALYSTRAWQRLSARVLRAWRGERGNWCPGYQRDAHPASDLGVDHVVPLAAGGAPFAIANCPVLCRSCNSTNGAPQPDRTNVTRLERGLAPPERRSRGSRLRSRNTDEFRVEVRKTGRGERHSPATTDLPITMRLAEPPEPFDWLRSA